MQVRKNIGLPRAPPKALPCQGETDPRPGREGQGRAAGGGRDAPALHGLRSACQGSENSRRFLKLALFRQYRRRIL